MCVCVCVCVCVCEHVCMDVGALSENIDAVGQVE